MTCCRSIGLGAFIAIEEACVVAISQVMVKWELQYLNVEKDSAPLTYWCSNYLAPAGVRSSFAEPYLKPTTPSIVAVYRPNGTVPPSAATCCCRACVAKRVSFRCSVTHSILVDNTSKNLRHLSHRTCGSSDRILKSTMVIGLEAENRKMRDVWTEAGTS